MATNRQNVKSATGEPLACVSASSRILQTSSSLFRSQMRPLGRQGQGSQSSGKERELPRVPIFVTELVLCALLPRPLRLRRRTEDGGTGGLVETLSLLCTPVYLNSHVSVRPGARGAELRPAAPGVPAAGRTRRPLHRCASAGCRLLPSGISGVSGCPRTPPFALSSAQTPRASPLLGVPAEAERGTRWPGGTLEPGGPPPNSSRPHVVHWGPAGPAAQTGTSQSHS